MHNNISYRDALTEVSVLYDVVNIARMNREPPYQYMVLEKVSGETAPTTNEIAVKLLERKKVLYFFTCDKF